MKFDRISRLLAGILLLSGSAVLAQLAPNISGPVFPNFQPPPPTPETVWQPEECDVYQDPFDPKRVARNDVGGPTKELYDDQLNVEINNDKANYFDQFIEFCSQQAQSARDPETAARYAYATARVEILVHRNEEARLKLAQIAEAYPAAAYRLGKMKKEEDGVAEPESKEFSDLIRLFKLAHDGGDKRATPIYADMLHRYFPAEHYNLPGFAMALLTGKIDSIPDTIETRMAASSYWEGMDKYCNMFATWVVSPNQQRDLDNMLIPVGVSRFLDFLKDIPGWGGDVQSWFNDPSKHNFLDVLRALNALKAAPSQVMFMTNQAANRDGYEVAQSFQCRGRRFERVVASLSELFAQRANANVSLDPSPAGEMEDLSQMPDLSVLLDSM